MITHNPFNIKNTDDLALVDQNIVETIKTAASKSPNHRARFCLHRSDDETVHEMIIAMTKSCHFPPHRHPGKTESFHMIEGSLYVIIYNDQGLPIKTVPMSVEKKTGYVFYYRMCSPYWHAVLPITDIVVFHETTTGPFVAGSSEFASFAPRENLGEYLKTSVAMCDCELNLEEVNHYSR